MTAWSATTILPTAGDRNWILSDHISSALRSTFQQHRPEGDLRSPALTTAKSRSQTLTTPVARRPAARTLLLMGERQQRDTRDTKIGAAQHPDDTNRH
jgi:hypothetical protein